MSIKVLQICVVTDARRGAERAVMETSRRMTVDDDGPDIDVAVAIIRTRRTPHFDVGRFAGLAETNLHEIVKRAPVDPTLLFRLGRLIRRLRPDIVHAHDSQSHLLALLLQPLYGFRMVATAPDVMPRDWKQRFSREVDNKLLPGFHRVIAANNELARQLCQLGCRPAQIDVIGGGVDTDRFSRDAVHEDVRVALGLGAGDKVVGIAADATKPDELEPLLKCVRAAQSDVGPLHVLILDGALSIDDVQQLAVRHGLGGRTHFWPQGTSRPSLYAALDVLLVGESTRRVPAPLLEGLSMELPIVCDDFHGVEDIVEHGTTGLVVPFDKSDELTAAIARLLTARGEAMAMASAGRLRVCQRYRASDHQQLVAQTYRRVMAEV